jgi:carbonic anhydrase
MKNDITADEALTQLIEGNQRFQRGESRIDTMSREDLAALAKGQRPFATILGCSDSRVAPELIFDAGLGELFVIRVAGNVLSPEVAGSMQYAGEHLETPLIVVLGHEGCGAIQAALATMGQGVRHHSRIQLLVDSIVPGLQALENTLPAEQKLAQAVEMNVRRMVHALHESPEGRARRAEGRVKCLGAIYDIENGQVRFLEPMPSDMKESINRPS